MTVNKYKRNYEGLFGISLVGLFRGCLVSRAGSLCPGIGMPVAAWCVLSI